MQKLLDDRTLLKLCDLVSPALLVSDPDRREELVRLTIRYEPATGGETVAQAMDRLNTLDSVERKASWKQRWPPRNALAKCASDGARESSRIGQPLRRISRSVPPWFSKRTIHRSEGLVTESFLSPNFLSVHPDCCENRGLAPGGLVMYLK